MDKTVARGEPGPILNCQAHIFGYTSGTGFDSSSPPPADPAFTDPPTDLKPVGASPAVGAGIHVDWITRDYLGSPVTDPPDLGAIGH
jgi:hypothetical protein